MPPSSLLGRRAGRAQLGGSGRRGSALAARALTGGMADPGDLLERHSELANIERLVARARSGAGLRLLVEGPAGAGKTRLLEAAVRAPPDSGMRVLEASASEPEAGLGFGRAR